MIRILVTIGVLGLSQKSFADVTMQKLRSYPTWIAVASCLKVTPGCENVDFSISREATKEEVCKKGRIAESCHLVNKAVDVIGSEQCMDNLAICLSLSPTPTLYCYKGWGIIGPLAGCDSAAHQGHVHVQAWGGCHKEAAALLKKKGITCD